VAKQKCPECQEEITVRKDGLLRVHYRAAGDPCPGGASPDPKNIEQKARQYLAQARVKVVRVAPGDCVILVQGSQPDPYKVRLVGDVWMCTCEARTWRCAHVVAGMLVVPDGMAIPAFGPQLDGELNTLLDEPSVVAEDVVEDQDWSDFVTTVEEDEWQGRT
jgi:uncharacterized Zn finger protein